MNTSNTDDNANHMESQVKLSKKRFFNKPTYLIGEKNRGTVTNCRR